MKNILLISGKARSGKDHVASALRIYSKFNIEVMHYADIMKDMICTLFDIPREQLDTYKNDKVILSTNCRYSKNVYIDFRKLLQRFGTETMKPIFGNDVWVKLMIERINKSKADYIIISDWRFKIEALDFVGKNYNIKKLKVYNVEGSEELNDEHISETEIANLDDSYFDYTYGNKFGTLINTNKILKEVEWL